MLVRSPPDCPSCSHLWTISSSWLEFSPTSPSLLSAQETVLWTRCLSTFPLLLPSFFSLFQVNELSFTLPACVSEIINTPPPPTPNWTYSTELLSFSNVIFSSFCSIFIAGYWTIVGPPSFLFNFLPPIKAFKFSGLALLFGTIYYRKPI